MTYLITGATGPIGRSLINQLLDSGQAVRAISREPKGLPAGVEIVQGDFTKGDLPAQAYRDVQGAFVFPAQGGVAAFLRQAQVNGVPRFVALSSLAAAQEHERDNDSISALHHLEIEKQVKATSVPSTILRPGTFATNLLFWAYSIRSSGAVQGPYALSKQAPIHEADIAAVAAAALISDGHVGQTYALTGPQSLTRVEQLEAIGQAIGRTLRFDEITPEAFQQAMAQFMPPPVVKMLLDHWSDTVTTPDVVLPTVEQVTGQKGRTLAQWARDHAADFS